jgi:Domain of unknown function (DUF4111)
MHNYRNKHDAPTPYADLNVVLREFVTHVRRVLGNIFVGAYLQGSFAVGDFDVYSDVDFLIICQDNVPTDRLPLLQAVHKKIFELLCPWAQHLEGSYIPKAALKTFPPPTRKFLYLDHGSHALVCSDHDDSLVVYWSFREKGIILIGPEPRSLIDRIPSDALKREILETMSSWREHWLANPEGLNNRFYQPFVVLSYCRMLHSLQTGAVESKRAGAMWAMEALDCRWRPLIQHALEARPGDAALKVCQQAVPVDLQGTWSFMQYALGVAQRPLLS